jgi:hypothetical protein
MVKTSRGVSAFQVKYERGKSSQDEWLCRRAEQQAQRPKWLTVAIEGYRRISPWSTGAHEMWVPLRQFLKNPRFLKCRCKLSVLCHNGEAMCRSISHDGSCKEISHETGNHTITTNRTKTNNTTAFDSRPG